MATVFHVAVWVRHVRNASERQRVTRNCAHVVSRELVYLADAVLIRVAVLLSAIHAAYVQVILIRAVRALPIRVDQRINHQLLMAVAVVALVAVEVLQRAVVAVEVLPDHLAVECALAVVLRCAFQN